MSDGVMRMGMPNRTQSYSTRNQVKSGKNYVGFSSVGAYVQASIANARQENAEDSIPYPIGVDSYTEAEWDNFLERFDATQDVIRQLMREKHQRLKEKQEERQEMRERELEKQLLEDELKEKEIHQMAQVESRIQHTLNQEVDIRYTTLFVKEGEQIREAGKIKKYEWS